MVMAFVAIALCLLQTFTETFVHVCTGNGLFSLCPAHSLTSPVNIGRYSKRYLSKVPYSEIGQTAPNMPMEGGHQTITAFCKYMGTGKKTGGKKHSRGKKTQKMLQILKMWLIY